MLAVALAPGAAMASNTATLSNADVALDLNNIRKSLMRMEDSIIFSLIERAQFKINNAVYQPDCAWDSPFRGAAGRAVPRPSNWMHHFVSQARSLASSSSTS